MSVYSMSTFTVSLPLSDYLQLIFRPLCSAVVHILMCVWSNLFSNLKPKRLLFLLITECGHPAVCEQLVECTVCCTLLFFFVAPVQCIHWGWVWFYSYCSISAWFDTATAFVMSTLILLTFLCLYLSKYYSKILSMVQFVHYGQAKSHFSACK